LDPQGKAVLKNLHNIDINEVKQLRIGKHITMDPAADDVKAAEAIVEKACKKLLANVIMERYEFRLEAKEE
jgi:phosphoribosylformylglycinamidine synthase